MEILSCSNKVLLHRDDNPLQRASQSYCEHTGVINDISISVTGRAMVSCGADGRLLVANLDTGHIVQQFTEKETITTARLNHQSDIIATGGDDSIVRLYDIKRKKVQSTGRQGGSIRQVDWKNNDILASCNQEGELTIIDSKESIKGYEQNEERGIVCRLYNTCDTGCLRFAHGQSAALASGQSDGSLTIWDIHRRSVIYDIYQPSEQKQESQSVNEIIFSPFNEVFMMSVSSDSHIRFYDIRAQKKVRQMTLQESVSAGDFHQDGHTIAIGTQLGNLLVYDLRKDLNRTIYQGHQGQQINRCIFINRDKVTPNQTQKVVQSMQAVQQPQQVQVQSKKQLPISFQDISLTNLKVSDEGVQQKYDDISYSNYNKQNNSVIKGNQVQQNNSIKQINNFNQKVKSKEVIDSNQQAKIKEVISKEIVNKIDANADFNKKQKLFIQEIITENQQNMTAQMQEGFQNIHVEMIRQFQIQLNQVEGIITKQLQENNNLNQQNKLLKEELSSIKNTPFQ